jgi:hypothetical protein
VIELFDMSYESFNLHEDPRKTELANTFSKGLEAALLKKVNFRETPETGGIIDTMLAKENEILNLISQQPYERRSELLRTFRESQTEHFLDVLKEISTDRKTFDTVESLLKKISGAQEDIYTQEDITSKKSIIDRFLSYSNYSYMGENGELRNKITDYIVEELLTQKNDDISPEVEIMHTNKKSMEKDYTAGIKAFDNLPALISYINREELSLGDDYSKRQKQIEALYQLSTKKARGEKILYTDLQTITRTNGLREKVSDLVNSNN